MDYTAVVVGSGPNGLSAAIELAQQGARVLVVEAAEKIGGGTRTTELTLPGFQHDFCSAVHPMGVLSPFWQTLPLEQYGLEWVYPELSVAHPLDDQPAVLLTKSLEETAEQLGDDGGTWIRMIKPLLRNGEGLLNDALGPLGIPRHPFLLTFFGLQALFPAIDYANFRFSRERAKALFAGCAGHSVLPLEMPLTSAIGLMFSLIGHMVDWPVAKGGSASITSALAGYFKAIGGEIVTSTPIRQYSDLPEADLYLFDTDPLQMAKICEAELPARYINQLRQYNFGPGTFKIDYALSEPIPWTDPNCLRASTVHVGGTMDEIASSERDAWEGRHAFKPYLIVCQQSQFDESRAPAGQHTGYAYCHVPNGSDVDMTDVIENQIRRFAPDFRDVILERHTTSTQAFERYNGNYVGGAITGGAADITQLFTRPVARFDPYSTPNPKIFICSHSSPPGGGVHGMCGYHAARSAIRRLS